MSTFWQFRIIILNLSRSSCNSIQRQRNFKIDVFDTKEGWLTSKRNWKTIQDSNYGIYSFNYICFGNICRICTDNYAYNRLRSIFSLCMYDHPKIHQNHTHHICLLCIYWIGTYSQLCNSLLQDLSYNRCYLCPYNSVWICIVSGHTGQKQNFQSWKIQ